MGWLLIKECTNTETDLGNVLLWNGIRVFLGWLNDDGWHDVGNRDHDDAPEQPQPTHYMPLPLPPINENTVAMDALFSSIEAYRRKHGFQPRDIEHFFYCGCEDNAAPDFE